MIELNPKKRPKDIELYLSTKYRKKLYRLYICLVLGNSSVKSDNLLDFKPLTNPSLIHKSI